MKHRKENCFCFVLEHYSCKIGVCEEGQMQSGRVSSCWRNRPVIGSADSHAKFTVFIFILTPTTEDGKGVIEKEEANIPRLPKEQGKTCNNSNPWTLGLLDIRQGGRAKLNHHEFPQRDNCL